MLNQSPTEKMTEWLQKAGSRGKPSSVMKDMLHLHLRRAVKQPTLFQSPALYKQVHSMSNKDSHAYSLHAVVLSYPSLALSEVRPSKLMLR